jgi:hypothetical protein
METSPLPVKSCKVRSSGPLSREEVIFIVSQWHLLWHGPRFFRYYAKDRPIQSSFTTHKGMWMIYSNPDPKDAGDLLFPRSSRVERICSQGQCVKNILTLYRYMSESLDLLKDYTGKLNRYSDHKLWGMLYVPINETVRTLNIAFYNSLARIKNLHIESVVRYNHMQNDDGVLLQW